MVYENMHLDPFWMYKVECYNPEHLAQPNFLLPPGNSQTFPKIENYFEDMLRNRLHPVSPMYSSYDALHMENTKIYQSPEIQLASMIESILPPLKPYLLPVCGSPPTDYTPSTASSPSSCSGCSQCTTKLGSIKDLRSPTPCSQFPIDAGAEMDVAGYVQLAPDKLRDPRGRMLLDYLHAAAAREEETRLIAKASPPALSIGSSSDSDSVTALPVVDVEPRPLFDLRTDTTVYQGILDRLNKLLKPNYTPPVFPDSDMWFILSEVAERQRAVREDPQGWFKVPELVHPKPKRVVGPWSHLVDPSEL